MKKYYISPMTGVSAAFQIVYPDTSAGDFNVWVDEQEQVASDPRVEIVAYANLCEKALDKLQANDASGTPTALSMITSALAHYETLMRVYTGLIGHRRYTALEKMPPVEAVMACVPDELDITTLM